MKTEFLSKRDAARYIGRSVSWLEKKEKEGEISHAYMQSGRRYFAVSDLDNLAVNFIEVTKNPEYAPNKRLGRSRVNYHSFVKLSSQS